jgi:hypothetical protein
MFDKLWNTVNKWGYDPRYRPALRYAFGATIIMGVAMYYGGDLSYIVPLLALNFLGPGTKKPTLKDSLEFILVVAISSLLSYFFTATLYQFIWVYILLLALILLWIYYTDKISFMVKMFLLISLLAMPVPIPGVPIKVWAGILAGTLIIGSVFTVIMVWFVYALFPDSPQKQLAAAPKGQSAQAKPGKYLRMQNALQTFIVTFPVILLFIFFQGGNALLVLIYIVILSMLPRQMGVMAGMGKVYGNIIGGAVTIVFYEILTVVPNYFFFLVLFLGIALLFARRVFSDHPRASLYKTGFSTLVLIIGSTTTGTDNAANEIYIRVFQVLMTVIYVVGAYALLDALILRKQFNRKRIFKRKIIAKV